jgi:hypothetical protein
MTFKQAEKKFEELKKPFEQNISLEKSEIEAALTGLVELYEDMDNYFDDRSESWQEGEKGEEYQDLMSEVEEFKDEQQDKLENGPQE